MPLVCEISIEFYCRRNDVIRPLNIHALNRLSPKLSIYAQFLPIYIAIAARYLPFNVSLT
jgi:hypothetical protein